MHDDAVHRADLPALWRIVVTHALRAAMRVDIAMVGPEADRAVRTFSLAEVAIDALLHDGQRHGDCSLRSESGRGELTACHEQSQGDIYDQFARRPANVHLLVRAAQNRSVAADARLFEQCAAWSEVARHIITVPAKRGGSGKGQRAERTAVVAVRFGAVMVRRPGNAGKSLPAELITRVVDVREVDPPADAQDRIHWCLLTTHAVETATDALQIVRWYRLRWIVEQVFRTMKTDGVDVETSQITSTGNLLKLLTVALIAALRVMQLVMGRTGQPLSDVIVDAAETPALQAINATLEGRTEKLKNPSDPSSLAWYAWIAARLGGWSGYTSKGYLPAGPKIMARGLKKLDAMVLGWLLATRSAVTGLR